MRLDKYRDVLRVPGVTKLLVIAIFARLPHSAAPLVLTLHVTLSMGMNFFDAGLVAAMATLGSAISGPWRGHLVDKYGLRRAVWPSIVVEIIYWGTVPHLPYWGLVGMALVGGAFSLPVFTVLRQALASVVPPDNRRAAFSLDSVGTELTFMMGPAIFATIAAVVSTELAMYLIGAAVTVSGIGMMILNPPTRGVPEENEDADARPQIVAVSAQDFVKSWRGIAILLASACATFILTGTDLGIIAFHRENNIISLVTVSIVVWCFGSLIGGIVYGTLHRPISPFVLLLCLGVVTIPSGLANSHLMLCVLVFVAGLLCAPMITSASEAIANMVHVDSRGQAMGWLGTAYTIGGGVAAPALGLVIDHYQAKGSFIAAGAIGLVVAAAGLATQRVKYVRRVSSQDI